MPCDTIQTASVDLRALGKLDAQLMLAALNGLKLGASITSDGVIRFGRGETINVRTGESQFSSLRDANEIRRAYSNQVVQYQAKKNGWTLKQTAPGQYEAMKRF